jgi:hypothetical protein
MMQDAHAESNIEPTRREIVQRRHQVSRNITLHETDGPAHSLGKGVGQVQAQAIDVDADDVSRWKESRESQRILPRAGSNIDNSQMFAVKQMRRVLPEACAADTGVRRPYDAVGRVGQFRTK